MTIVNSRCHWGEWFPIETSARETKREGCNKTSLISFIEAYIHTPMSHTIHRPRKHANRKLREESLMMELANTIGVYFKIPSDRKAAKLTKEQLMKQVILFVRSKADEVEAKHIIQGRPVDTHKWQDESYQSQELQGRSSSSSDRPSVELGQVLRERLF
jgi:hypothetical protein